MTESDLAYLHSIPTDSSTSLRGVLALLLGLSGFLLAGHNSIIATATIVSVLSIQGVTGGIVWILLSRQKHDSPFELVGMGCVIGFLLATISDQVFRFNLLSTVSWLLPSTVVGLAFFVPWVRTQMSQHTLSAFSIEDATFILCVSLIGQGLDNNASTIAALVLGSSLILPHIVRKMFGRSRIAIHSVPIAGIFTAIVVYWFISGYPKLENQLLRSLFSGTVGVDDRIYSEQMSWSIANWGLSTNSAAMGLPIKYHWLSLGWSGMISKAAHLEPFVVTLHVIPIVACIVIACLAVAIAQRLTSAQWLYYLAPFLLLATDNNGRSLRFFELNTSNLLSHIWFIGFFVAFHKHLHEKLRFPQIVLPALAVATTLSKGPYGVVLCVGVVAAAVVVFFTKSSTRFSTISALSISGLASVIAYLVFIVSPLTSYGYSFYWPQFIALFPFPLPNTTAEGTRGLVLGLVVLLIFVLTRFAGAWKLLTPRPGQNAFNALILGASIAGFLAFVVKNFEAERYFINAGLVAGSIATLVALATYESESRKISILEVTKVICLTLLFFFASRVMLAIGLQQIGAIKILEYQLKLIIACLSSVLAISTLFIHDRYSASKSSFGIKGTNIGYRAVISLVTVSMLAFSTQLAFRSYDFTGKEASVPNEELKALSWIRNHIPENAVLATNRSICPNTVTCDEFDSSSHLVSAMSRRRVLIEGPRFLLPTQFKGLEYPTFLEPQVSASLGFIRMPSEDRLNTLRRFGVTWLYVVLDADLPSSWAPWGTTVFRNSIVAVVKLRDDT